VLNKSRRPIDNICFICVVIGNKPETTGQTTIGTRHRYVDDEARYEGTRINDELIGWRQGVRNWQQSSSPL
jgi:hypothetical protein